MTKAQNIVTSITVEIEAPASVVWKVLTDLDRYSEWNTFCPGIKSTLKLGDPVTMTVKIPTRTNLGPQLNIWCVSSPSNCCPGRRALLGRAKPRPDEINTCKHWDRSVAPT